MASDSFSILPSSIPTLSQFRGLLQGFASPSTDRVTNFLYCSIFRSQDNGAKEAASEAYHYCPKSVSINSSGLLCLLATTAACTVAYKLSQRRGTGPGMVSEIPGHRRESDDNAKKPTRSETEQAAPESKGNKKPSINSLKRNGKLTISLTLTL